jgi:hypothetical protein
MKNIFLFALVFFLILDITFCNAQESNPNSYSTIVNVKVNVTQKFNKGIVEIPFVEKMSDIFTEYSHIRIVTDNTYNAIININAKGYCSGATYGQAVPVFYFTGGKVEGSMNFNIDNIVFKEKFKGAKNVPMSIELYGPKRTKTYDEPSSKLLLNILETSDFYTYIFYFIETVHGPERLQQYIENDSANYKVQMVKALGFSSNPKAGELLLKYFREDSLGFKSVAMWGLGKSKNTEAVLPLINMAIKGGNKLTGLAITTLGEIGDKRAMEPLYKIYKENTTKMTRDALIKIAEMRNIQNIYLFDMVIKKRIKKYKNN